MKDISNKINDYSYRIKFILQDGYNRNKYVLYNLHYEIDRYTHWGKTI